MIPRLEAVVDLGLDRNRKPAEDAARQRATVNRILTVFFGPPEVGTEIQLLTDEVGLGEDLCALATAHAILNAIRHKPAKEQLPDLKNCYRHHGGCHAKREQPADGKVASGG